MINNLTLPACAFFLVFQTNSMIAVITANARPTNRTTKIPVIQVFFIKVWT